MAINLPALIVTAALTAASTALNMTKTIEGPRLDNLKASVGDYGAPLALAWGTVRLQPPVFWAEPLTEVKRRRKTKGGKFNDYSYFGTWAVALAGHEIAAVSRVWFDAHLVYDMTGAGPVSPFDFGDNAAGSISDYVAIYLGTATQDADERMQATVEAANGAGSCPAYRGLSYIVFKDVPLEKLGNRIPQVSVEFTTASTDAFPDEQAARTLTGVNNAAFSPDFSRLVTLGYSGSLNNTWIEVYDVAGRTSIFVADHGEAIRAESHIGIFADGTVYATGTKFAGSAGSNLTAISPDGVASEALVFDAAHNSRGIYVIADGDGTEHWFSIPSTSSQPFYADGTLLEIADLAPFSGEPYSFFSDGEDIWCAGTTTTDELFFLRVVTVSDTVAPDYLLTGITVTTSADPVEACWCDYAGHFVAVNQTGIGAADAWAIDPAGATIASASWTWTTRGNDITDAFAPITSRSTSLWIANREFSLTDLSVLRTVTLTDWNALTNSSFSLYDPVNHALACYQSTGGTHYTSWLYLDRVGSAGVALGDIAADLADRVGATDYDFTALDQVVKGWSATQGSARAMLEPLLDAWDSDIAPHDFGIRGVKRGGTASLTLATERFAKGSGPRYAVTVRQASELPRALTYNFADIDADQQPNNVPARRPLDTTGARAEASIDLTTMASDPDEMRGLADRHFRRIWNERREAKLALTAQQLVIEPCDLRVLELDGDEWPARCVRTTIGAGGVIDTEWRYDHPSLAALSGASGAAFDGREPAVVVVPLLSKGFVLDVPLLRDADSSASPLVYVAAAPWATGSWPGATFYQSVSGEYTDELAGVSSTSQATWGYTTDALADTALPWVWDRGSSVNVALQVGTLTGTTEAALDANARLNLCLIGDELVQFTTATMEGDGSYTLSGFKRGRRGTEWATAGHAARDVFLLLDTAAGTALGLSEVGTNLSFKAVTAGRSEAGAYPIALAPFSGASLKPYSPVHLAATLDAGTGDWALEWVRRTRVGAAWTSGTTIPLSEASEEYEVEIMDGATVKRTFTGLTSPAASYTAAQQTTDWGSGQTSITFRVYQISDAVGRGFVAEATA